MIGLMGGKYTGYMTPDHTHLVCGSTSGEKYAKAQSWGIRCVNHLWLEDAFAAWRCPLESAPRYQCFSAALVPLVGATVPHHVPGNLKEDMVTEEEEDVVAETDTDSLFGVDDDVPNEKADRHGNGSKSNLIRTMQGADDDSATDQEDGSFEKDVAVKKQDTGVVDAATRSRRGQSKASLAAQEAKAQNPARTSTPAKNATTTKAGSAKKTAASSSRRKREDSEEDEDVENHPTSRKKAKRPAATSKAGSIDNEAVLRPSALESGKGGSPKRGPVVFLFTGVKPTADELKVFLFFIIGSSDLPTLNHAKKFKAIEGAKEAKRPELCTHLIAAKIARTEKFLAAISGSPFIVTKAWFDACIAAKSYQGIDLYMCMTGII